MTSLIFLIYGTKNYQKVWLTTTCIYLECQCFILDLSFKVAYDFASSRPYQYRNNTLTVETQVYNK